MNRIRLALLSLALALVLVPPGPGTARPDARAVLSPLAFELLDPPVPVKGADGRMHLAYELLAVNQSALAVSMERIEVRSGGSVLGSALSGASLAERTRLNAGGSGTTLGPGESATVFVDATYPAGRPAPRSIAHRIRLSWPDAADPSVTRSATIAGVRSPVPRAGAILLDPPLRGGRWVATSSCCTLQPHRGATLSVDGTVRAPERFAIDFVRLNREWRLLGGPIEDPSSWGFIGTRVRSAAPGRVVRVRDDLPDQVPGSLPPNATIQMAGGNHVVVDIGRGRFAFYAHLQPGSVEVRVGQRVRSGQVLGLLGNSGNTDGPHLHFHVMDSPSPLQSNGLPYRFRAFRGQGRVTDLDAMLTGGDPGVDRSSLARRHRAELPMDLQVLAFPASIRRRGRL